MSSDTQDDSYDFWSQVIPQSKYRKTVQEDGENVAHRFLELDLTDLSKLPVDQKKLFRDEVSKMDAGIIHALLDEKMAAVALKDGHLETLLKSLGL